MKASWLNAAFITSGIFLTTLIIGGLIFFAQYLGIRSYVTTGFSIIGPDIIIPKTPTPISWIVSKSNKEKYPYEKIEICQGIAFGDRCTTLVDAALNNQKIIIIAPSSLPTGTAYLRMTARDTHKQLVIAASSMRQIRVVPSVSLSPRSNFIVHWAAFSKTEKVKIEFCTAQQSCTTLASSIPDSGQSNILVAPASIPKQVGYITIRQRGPFGILTPGKTTYGTISIITKRAPSEPKQENANGSSGGGSRSNSDDSSNPPQQSNTPPQLTAKNIGVYGGQAWGNTSTPPAPTSSFYRTRSASFSIRSIKANTDQQVSSFDAASLISEVQQGLQYNPIKSDILRIDFWSANNDRTTGAIASTDVYAKRLFGILTKLEPIVGSIQGISLSEENISEGGRIQVLQSLYDQVKQKYPSLSVYQWWTPNTKIPGTYSGTYLSADGWIIDPYTIADDQYQSIIQKYFITGKPIVPIIWASSDKSSYYPDMWQHMDKQLSINRAYNLPTAFYWVYNQSSYFPEHTSSSLMNQITQKIYEYMSSAKQLPDSYTGNENIADIWNSSTPIPFSTKTKPQFIETFATQGFLDRTSGIGFRNMVWKPELLSFRSFQTGSYKTQIQYRITGANSLSHFTTTVKGSGSITVSLSADKGRTWSTESAYNATTNNNSTFTKAYEVWVRITVTGDDTAPATIQSITLTNE